MCSSAHVTITEGATVFKVVYVDADGKELTARPLIMQLYDIVLLLHQLPLIQGNISGFIITLV